MQALPLIDKILSKTISRKLMVFIIASLFFWFGVGISSEDWIQIATIYIGAQGAVDTAKEIFKARSGVSAGSSEGEERA
jgi:hypothetical protein